jgi:hypothetical protein
MLINIISIVLSNCILFVDGQISKRIRELKDTVRPPGFLKNISMHPNAMYITLGMIIHIKIVKFERVDYFSNNI